jgi:hypothetical protein
MAYHEYLLGRRGAAETLQRAEEIAAGDPSLAASTVCGAGLAPAEAPDDAGASQVAS